MLWQRGRGQAALSAPGLDCGPGPRPAPPAYLSGLISVRDGDAVGHVGNVIVWLVLVDVLEAQGPPHTASPRAPPSLPPPISDGRPPPHNNLGREAGSAGRAGHSQHSATGTGSAGCPAWSSALSRSRASGGTCTQSPLLKAQSPPPGAVLLRPPNPIVLAATSQAPLLPTGPSLFPSTAPCSHTEQGTTGALTSRAGALPVHGKSVCNSAVRVCACAAPGGAQEELSGAGGSRSRL